MTNAARRCPSRTRKAVFVLARFRGGCHRQSACPTIIVSSGGRNRTCTHPLNRRLPYRLATPEKIGRDAETAATASPCHFKSAQRELNSRLLHGKQMGYHYTMGAGCFAKLSKIRAPCESRTRIPSIRRKYLAVRRPGRGACFVSGIRGTRTLTTVVKSHVCCR